MLVSNNPLFFRKLIAGAKYIIIALKVSIDIVETSKEKIVLALFGHQACAYVVMHYELCYNFNSLVIQQIFFI